jgi:hypothetical protein
LLGFGDRRIVSRWREVGHSWGIGTGLLNLGLVTRELGDTRRAAALFRECVPLAVRQGDGWGLVELFAGLADIAVRAGDAGLGARLLGTAERMQSEMGTAAIARGAHPNTGAGRQAARVALGDAVLPKPGAGPDVVTG